MPLSGLGSESGQVTRIFRSVCVRSRAFVIHMASTTSPRSALILVVEDDPLQRFGMIDLVEDAGFVAIEAQDADQAVEILESRLDVRVVFTDIDMPGSMDGLKLAAAIRKRWPPIEIIVTSGRHRPTIEELPARAAFLPKPLVPSDAIRVLQSFAG